MHTRRRRRRRWRRQRRQRQRINGALFRAIAIPVLC
jgi:hypothetical protein